MKIEIVTPAGRKRYLEVLFLHLKSQKKDFDRWTLWLNTTNQEDIDFCKQLEKENDWIRTIDLDEAYAGNESISSFFKYAKDKDSIYIRFDDDVVWIEEGFIKKLCRFRIENPQYFLVYGNIVNNAIIDHLHQRIGALEFDNNAISYLCGDDNGWKSSEMAEIKHRNFLKKLSCGKIDSFKFNKWDLFFNERVSINCISWLGESFLDIDKSIDEEQFLSVDYPKSKGLINTIYGEAVCSHFAFYTQREKLDKTELLSGYKKLID